MVTELYEAVGMRVGKIEVKRVYQVADRMINDSGERIWRWVNG